MWPNGGLTLINARVVSAAGEARTVRIAGDRIADFDVDPAPRDVVVDCDGAVVLPGLVNAHDHLARNHFGRLKWRDRHANVREWIADFQPRFGQDPELTGPMSVAAPDALWFGALKNLVSGVTTVCHHDPIGRSVIRDLPVRLALPFGYSHSLPIDGAIAVTQAYRRTRAGRPWIVHAAEGVDTAAAAEFEELERLGCVGPATVIVHGVGLDTAARSRLRRAGGSMVWCPASNRFLFGATVDPADMAGPGRLALGTDSRLSGSRDLLDELAVARASTTMPDTDLVRLVLDHAGDVLRMPDAGRLVVGGPADVTVWRPRGDAWPSALIGASRRDLRLVMVGGEPLVATPELRRVFESRGDDPVTMELDGEPHLFARHLAARIARLPIAEPGLNAVGEAGR